jgi:predicted nuclease of predicted toxin-antitoxin system
MTRVLLDQGLPRSAAQLLRAEGWDVVHVSEAGMSRSPDTEILKIAHDDNRTLVTLDADFHALLAVQGLARPSVIRIRWEGLGAQQITRLLMDIWPRVHDDIESGAMVTVDKKSVRVHRLPTR